MSDCEHVWDIAPITSLALDIKCEKCGVEESIVASDPRAQTIWEEWRKCQPTAKLKKVPTKLQPWLIRRRMAQRASSRR